MSQISSQAQDPFWVSIPFEKFSHNSSPVFTCNFTWTHVVVRNNLDFILRDIREVDDHGNCNTRIVMKIIAGAEVLEEQDLGELVQAVRAFDPSSGNEKPVLVTTKSPFLGMRYSKSANIVRRIQLKFHNDSDLFKAFHVMKDLGLPVDTETTPTTSFIAQPSVSPAPSLLSTTSVSSSVSIPSMISASSASSAPSAPSPRAAFNTAERTFEKLLNTTSNSSPRSEFKVPVRLNSSSSKARRSMSVLPYIHPQNVRPATILGVFAPPGTTSPLPSPGLFNDSRKQSPLLYLSQVEKESQLRRLSHPVSPNTSRRGTGSQQDLPKPKSLSQLKSQQESLSNRIQDSDDCLSASPFFTPRDESLCFTGVITGGLKQSGQEYERRQSDSLGPQRPDSKLSEKNKIPNLWIPPRRELSCSNPADVYKQRSASFSDLPPLPKPTPVTRSGSVDAMISETVSTASIDSTPLLKPTKKRIAQRKATAAKPFIEGISPANTSNVVATNAEAVREDEESLLAARGAAASSIPSSAAPRLQSKVTAPKKRAAVSAPARSASSAKKPKMIDHGTQTQTLYGRDHTTATRLSNDEVPPIVIHPPPATSASSPIPEDHLDVLEHFITKHKARPIPREIWEAPGYVDADEEQRQIILNHFICENLENIDFLQLCKDTENAWRRIGLGM